MSPCVEFAPLAWNLKITRIQNWRRLFWPVVKALCECHGQLQALLWFSKIMTRVEQGLAGRACSSTAPRNLFQLAEDAKPEYLASTNMKARVSLLVLFVEAYRTYCMSNLVQF